MTLTEISRIADPEKLKALGIISETAAKWHRDNNRNVVSIDETPKLYYVWVIAQDQALLIPNEHLNGSY